MQTEVMFSNAKNDWQTPLDLYERLNAEFRFTVDAAAEAHNALQTPWLGLDKVPGGYAYDALTTDWLWQFGAGPYFCNPPYDKCAQFVAKAAEEAKKGCTVVLLIPARPDTKYWAAHIWDHDQHRPRPGVEVRFLKGRLRFVGAIHSAPFPSAVIVMRPHESGATVDAVGKR